MYKNKLILGIITARGGSKGVPRKNIRPLAGKPLIAHSILRGKGSKYIDRLVLSSDDEEIIGVGRSYGAEVPFVRPAELATDTAKSLPVIQHAIEFCEKQEGRKYDLIALFEPTAPMGLSEDVDKCIEIAAENDADSVLGIEEVGDWHPVRAKKIVNGRIEPFIIPEPEGMRRQDQEKAYFRNGSVYILRRDNLMENDSLWGEVSLPYIMPEERSTNIDNEVDFVRAEYWFKKRGY
ncbi:acylneuraminate cytidylyltransferase family protein [Patescibacteria group bacterium]|nr:acylneuraminate cytidylyltransferase family protein [Patescibacteria group bacterium]